jgi:predicted ATPase
LHRMSGGNPLFLRAALDHLGELQLASRTSHGWEFAAPLPEADPPVPQAVQVVIESQLQSLGQQERHALEAASLAGRVFTATEAARAFQNDVAELQNVLESLVRRKRILRRAPAQPCEGRARRYEFINPLYRDVLCRRPTP